MSNKSNLSFWNNIAFLYSKFMSKNEAIYNDALEKIAPYFNEDKDVLELACGTGQFTFSLADKCKSFIATDFSSAMVNETKNNYSGNKALFKVEDATNISYEDNSFDIILVANALHVMPEPELAMQEIIRVLKPQGLLIAPTFIFDKNMSSLRIWLLEKIGFKTYNKWNKEEFENFIKAYNFKIVSSEAIFDKSLSQCILIAENKE